ncbi:MAG: SusD/RagB family nutrient-binding outer membrane lipoprotein [Puia sp.]|nr:SusD/RagB family nutrient-binding outer membrane lipoprotein [Puia sp.]
MKSAIKIFKITGVLLAAVIVISSCQKFSALNTNPNAITPANAAPDYLMASVLTQAATQYGNLGSGQMSGAMQQTAQDAFGGSYSMYDWETSDWTSYYNALRDNKLLLQKAQANNWKFHQGVALIMRAFIFGTIADLWGDAPDSMAVKGDEGGLANEFPTFDSQQSMYNGVIADLKAAIPFLSGTMSDHPEITAVTSSSDVFYAGDPTEWTKVAYSLLLRYYLRLSPKMDEQANVEAVAPYVFASNDDDWAMSFPGKDANSSYQKASTFSGASNFNRNKMSATLTYALAALKDPRIVIMAQPVTTPSRVDGTKFSPGDDSTLTTIIGGIRYINPNATNVPGAIAKYKQFDPNTYATDRPWGAALGTVWSFYDTASVYVGIPISYSYNDFSYNINGVGTQANSNNSYVSYLRNDIYNATSGPLLKQRMASYNEICFDLAEAALKGWNVGGTAEQWYYAGIQASFDLWTVFSNYQSDVNNYYGCVKTYNDYIAQSAVAYNGTLQQIIQQKWIASWQASVESYMDWRRTGYPAISVGWASYRDAIPLRFAYYNTELQNNPTNSAAAIALLAPTAYNGPDGNNSAWSKTWLLQGLTIPY